MCKDWIKKHLSRDGQTTAVVRVGIFCSGLLWQNRKQIWHANFMRIKTLLYIYLINYSSYALNFD